MEGQRKDGGDGLFSVSERVRFAGGEVEIDTAPGDGTLVSLSIPCEQVDKRCGVNS